MTKAEKAIAYFQRRHGTDKFRELTSTSKKYRKFTHPINPKSFIWIGRAGAVLSGRTVSDSVSITAQVEAWIARDERVEAGK